MMRMKRSSFFLAFIAACALLCGTRTYAVRCGEMTETHLNIDDLEEISNGIKVREYLPHSLFMYD